MPKAGLVTRTGGTNTPGAEMSAEGAGVPIEGVTVMNPAATVTGANGVGGGGAAATPKSLANDAMGVGARCQAKAPVTSNPDVAPAVKKVDG
ncbi:MAG: hypothetical protein DHS20C11_36660 [Lysobacteraceae bacterium]|nr:MAG: hypothetical protein DHS20C11_36660 [Xanthomonadaceae bacterium]